MSRRFILWGFLHCRDVIRGSCWFDNTTKSYNVCIHDITPLRAIWNGERLEWTTLCKLFFEPLSWNIFFPIILVQYTRQFIDCENFLSADSPTVKHRRSNGRIGAWSLMFAYPFCISHALPVKLVQMSLACPVAYLLIKQSFLMNVGFLLWIWTLKDVAVITIFSFFCYLVVVVPFQTWTHTKLVACNMVFELSSFNFATSFVPTGILPSDFLATLTKPL